MLARIFHTLSDALIDKRKTNTMRYEIRALPRSLCACASGLALLLPGLFSTATAAPRSCQVAQTLPTLSVENGEKLFVTADRAEVTADGVSTFQGKVTVTRGVQQIAADEAIYDPASGKISVNGRATYREPGFEVSADDAKYDAALGKIEFGKATFEIPGLPAKGEAEAVKAGGDGKMSMDQIIYTTCLEKNPDWELRARDLDLDLRESHGVARKVSLYFKDIPILYLPYISFPLDKTRKSGLLFPEFGNSDNSGTEISVPFYWNIAPNYDAIITPRYLSDRGMQWNGEGRYLTRTSRGEVEFQYLKDDDKFGKNRRYSRVQHVTDLPLGWRVSADIQEVSDRSYFEDLGTGTDITSQTHLLRNLELAYLGDNWQLLARGRNYQTIDSGIRDPDKPYERLPQVVARGRWDDGLLGLSYGIYSEFVDFRHDVNVEGWRVLVEPEVSLPIEGPGYFLEPKVAWRHTRYELDDRGPDEDDTPTMTAPIFSIDGGLIFERESDEGNYVQTIEPRVLYANIPSRGQNSMPLFDTGDPDFNMVQLFRPNRFVGGDRLGDTEQISIGVTTRMINAETGREFLTATLGQAFYLSNRNVSLTGDNPDSDNESDIVAEIGLDIFKNWNADFGYQWDRSDQDTSLAEARVQYQPAPNKVVNLTYRYRPALLEQAELSLGWPVTNSWSFVGSIEYSLRDTSTVDRLLGIQYESCCWAARLASRRQVSNRDGTFDTSVMLQLEFKGLAGVGANARKRFEGDILGYSVYE
jgi:LPS-assembly protein